MGYEATAMRRVAGVKSRRLLPRSWVDSLVRRRNLEDLWMLVLNMIRTVKYKLVASGHISRRGEVFALCQELYQFSSIKVSDKAVFIQEEDVRKAVILWATWEVGKGKKEKLLLCSSDRKNAETCLFSTMISHKGRRLDHELTTEGLQY